MSMASTSGNPPSRRVEIAWLGVLIIVAIVSVAVVSTMPPLGAEWLLAMVWGIFIGGTLLVFLPSKVLITIVGGLFGVGVVDLTGAAKIVESFAKAVANIIKTINSALAGEVVLHAAPVWVFFVFVFVCCLPAYRSEQ